LVPLRNAQEVVQVLALKEKMYEKTRIQLVAMEKLLVGCGAATCGVCRVFDHEAPIAIVYYLRGRVRFARSAQAHDVLALRTRQGKTRRRKTLRRG
jgi:hypothetical protein